MVASEVVGFDAPAIEDWLATVTDVRPPCHWTRLAGGHSNLTYRIRDQKSRELVIRRPPLGPLLPKAHDMWREYRIVQGLWSTAVPVPEPVAYCDDRAVAETHFYVMGCCPGEALYTARAAGGWLDVAARRRAGEQFVDVLAALHSVDPAAVGLGDLGRPDGYLARQLKTWYSSWTTQIPNAGFDDRRVHVLHELLHTEQPGQTSSGIVHGDFGPHNVLFTRTGAISAVLDWEIATLGDTLADLGYSINAWVGPGDEVIDVADPATALPGFLTQQQVATRYVEATGADLADLQYYRVFNFWKRACILHGVYARYQTGQKSTEGVHVSAVLKRIERSLEAADEMARQLAGR
jgi:aminoglycoside phosphotransferase (APT) family kinase protein